MSKAEMGAALMNLFVGILTEVNEEACEITITIDPYTTQTLPANLAACSDIRPLDCVRVTGQRITIDIQYKEARALTKGGDK